MALSPAKIKQLAYNAGFTGKTSSGAVLSEVMTAIALAESGGNPRAHNATPPDNSYGLWQINMLGAMGPSRRQAFGISSNSALYDPKTNAKAAKIIYDGQGLSAWTTYTSGAYRSHMDEANVAAEGPITAGGPDSTKTSVDLNPVDNVINQITAFANEAGFRIGMFLGGGLLILLGVGIFLSKMGIKRVVKSTGITRTLDKIAENV